MAILAKLFSSLNLKNPYNISMNSIFDQNSEFLKYLKDKNGDAIQNPNPNSGQSSASSSQNFNSQQGATTSKDSYVLDLKSHQLKDPGPVEEVPVKKIDQNTQPKATPQTPKAPVTPNPKLESKINKINKLSTPKTGPLAFIVDKIKFLLVSAIIFAITFGAINYPAYSKIVSNWYLDLTGQTETTAINQFSERNNPTSDLASDLNLEFVTNTDIPKLDFQLTPPGTRVIIPRLQSNVPVIHVSSNTLVAQNWDAVETEIQDALRNGVVHYPGTPFPNQSGNVVLTGHSSYYPWDPGRFKDVFAVLHQAEIGDEIIMFYEQKKYTYKVTEIKKVFPNQIDVLADAGDDRLTLITCTPIGTNLQRLIVVAKPVES